MTEFLSPDEWAKRISNINTEMSVKMTDEPYEVSLVKCDLCSHQWVAVRPMGTPKLECPKCGNVAMFENISTQ